MGYSLGLRHDWKVTSAIISTGIIHIFPLGARICIKLRFSITFVNIPFLKTLTGKDIHKIFEITSVQEFNAKALKIFYYQYQHCEPYQRFIQYLGINPAGIQAVEHIPFLPIELFKTQLVHDGATLPDLLFTSSGTTGQQVSKHYITDPEIYKTSVLQGFRLFFGEPSEYCIIGLLPGYMERKESSLVYMVNYLQQLSNHELNGNFLNDFDEVARRLQILETQGQKTLLFGVTYALLDFAAAYPRQLQYTQVIETGGMKGQRKEMTRDELHATLQQGFGPQPIVSEYGMTELLSQAWYLGGSFACPPWMKILVRDKNDPLTVNPQGTGGINVVDLANVHSCSFIATGDAGRLYPNGQFEVLGRLDNRDIRGCNLMYEL